MNFTFFDSSQQDLERLAEKSCVLHKILIFVLVIIWMFVISLFFQILLSKLVSYRIVKFLKNNGLDSVKFHFGLHSFQFNLISLCFVFNYVNLCIQNFCHIEVAQIRFKLFKQKSSKKFCIQFKDVRIILFDKILLINPSPIFVQNISKISSSKFIYDFQNFVIYLNHFENKYEPSILRVKRFIFTLEKFNLVRSQDENYYLNSLTRPKLTRKRKPIYKKNDVESQNLNKQPQDNIISYLIFNLVDFDLSFRSQNITKIERLKVHFYNGNIPKYVLKNNNKIFEINDLSFMVKIEVYDYCIINLCDENLEILLNDSVVLNNLFYDFKKSFVFIFDLKKFQLNFLNDKQTIFKLDSVNSSIEVARDSNKFTAWKFLLNNVSFSDFLNPSPIYNTKFLYINLKIEAENRSIKVNVAEKSSFNLKNLIANYKMLDLISNKIRTQIFKVKFKLIGTFDSTEIEFPFDTKVLHAQFKQISFKIENLDKLTSIFIFEHFNLYTNNDFFHIDENLFVYSERLVLESKSKPEGTKIQFILSPIQITTENLTIERQQTSETNLSIESFESYLYTQILDEVSPKDIEGSTKFNLNNRLFLTVLQFRYESFKNNEEVYSKFYEFIFGDFFGSVDFKVFLNFLNLIGALCKLISKEIEFESFIDKSELNYKSIRILTSLINFNIFNNFDLTDPLQVVIFNLICSPINYASCNFHCENKQPGSLATLSDFCIKILTSNENENNLVETGIFYLKFLSFLKLENQLNNDKMIEYLTQNDQESKRLNFIWNQNLCSCVGENSFFSDQKELLYSYENDFKFKPCIYSLNKTDSIKYGFGQSILEPNEFIFYSYRKLFQEYDFYSFKIQTGKKFTVISNIESNDKYVKKKFEPLEISVYDQELNMFMNETIDINSLKPEEIEDLNFKSTNMSPPYFSNDFSMYIRYLPKVKHFSNIVYKPHEKSSLRECYNEIVYPEDSINIPFSDLNVDFFNKTSSAFKKIRFNWLKNYKKSFKKSLMKKSTNLKEIKDMKFKHHLTSLSSLSLNSLDENENFNQNNNKPSSTPKETSESNKKKKSSSQRTKQTIKKSNLFVYKLNLNQILYGFKQNDGKISGKKLYVEEIYIQTVYLSNEYEYENSYRDFLFEQSANQELNETSLILSGLKSKFCVSKTYFLLSKTSIECVSNMLEFVYTWLNRNGLDEQHVRQSENLLAFTQNNRTNMENFAFDKHVYFDQIYLQIIQISGSLDRIVCSDALRFKMTSSSFYSNRVKHFSLIALRKIQINHDNNNNNKIAENFHDTLENLCRRLLHLLIDKVKISIFKIKIVSTNLIINQLYTLPEFEIELSYTKYIHIHFEFDSFKFTKIPLKISTLNNLIRFTFNSILFFSNLSQKPNYKISILVKNFFIKFKLNHNDDDNDKNENNYLINLSGTNFKLAYNSTSSDIDQNQKFNYHTNFAIDLIEIVNSIEKSNIKFNFELNKKLLDANLFAQIQLNDTYFNFNFIFPLIVESKFSFSNDSLEWQTPGLLFYSTWVNQVYQLSDLNRIKVSINFNDEKILVEIDKVRFIRSKIDFDLSSALVQLLEKMDFSDSDPYILNLKVKNLCINYFSDGFSVKSWFFLKLFDVNISYSYLFDTNLVEDFTIDFKDSLVYENDSKLDYVYLDDTLHSANLRINKSILFYVSSSSSIFTQFDLNKWLDYCCMENNDAFGYNIKFISALPCLNLELNYETKVSSSVDGKLVQIYWKFRHRNQQEKNPHFFVLNPKNLELIEKKIFFHKKLTNASSMLNGIENYYTYSKQQQQAFNIRVKDLNGNLLTSQNFESKNFAFFIKNNLLKHILIVYKILSMLNKNK